MTKPVLVATCEDGAKLWMFGDDPKTAMGLITEGDEQPEEARAKIRLQGMIAHLDVQEWEWQTLTGKDAP